MWQLSRDEVKGGVQFDHKPFLSVHRFRFGNRLVDGVDLLCAEGSQVFAPFSGQISFHSPFGDHSCTDQGVKIAGEGQWQGDWTHKVTQTAQMRVEIGFLFRILRCYLLCEAI